MNIVFTCGGTGGHIYPAIAVARMFRERQPDCRILFIGAEDASLAERASGSINYVYLHDGILSDAWIYAEGLNWLTPAIRAEMTGACSAPSAAAISSARWRSTSPIK